MYKRTIIQELTHWKNSIGRKPLVLRGARQVGKTTVVNMFASQFQQYLSLNLEREEDKLIFQKYKSIDELIQAVFFFKKKEINNTSTLIFIDEIQEVPEALGLLRYFYENYPQFYVIVAGSLLESLFNSQVSFPVGRVEYRVLRPFSFEEFLDAMDETAALQQYRSCKIASFAHEKLLKLFHDYTLIGGMPEVVRRYIETKDFLVLQHVYDSLMLSYMEDVEKYAKNQSQVQFIRHAIKASFYEAGSRIKFQGFGQSSYSSREMGEALRTIERAMLIQLVYPTTQTNLPYLPDIKKSPKLQVLDTGMLNYFSGLQQQVFGTKDLNTLYQGKIAEHIVGQELLANKKRLLDPLCFWVREKRESVAEIDYLFPFEGKMIPVEVKSGQTGRLRSLLMYMDLTEESIAIRLYAGEQKIDILQTVSGKTIELHNLPYYLAGNLYEYLKQINNLQ